MFHANFFPPNSFCMSCEYLDVSHGDDPVFQIKDCGGRLCLTWMWIMSAWVPHMVEGEALPHLYMDYDCLGGSPCDGAAF